MHIAHTLIELLVTLPEGINVLHKSLSGVQPCIYVNTPELALLAYQSE